MPETTVTRHTVCLCFGKEKCQTETEELALRNHAAGYEIIPVATPYSRNLAYKGVLIMRKEN